MTSLALKEPKSFDEQIDILKSRGVVITDNDKAKFVQHNEMFNEGYGTPLILIIGNGSGGHFYPSYVVAKRLEKECKQTE